MHHPARKRTRFANLDRVTKSREMVGRRQAARPGAYDEHALTGGRRLDRELPALGCRHITEEALDGMDADRAIELLAIAAVFARVVADAAVDGGQRIVFDERKPSLIVAALPRMREPGLNVFTGGTRIVAGREEVDVDRSLRARWTRALCASEVDHRRHIGKAGAHHSQSPGVY
jgi:hypothetical protein